MDLFYRLILILVSILSEWRFLMTSWWQICFPSRAQTPVPAACHRGCSTDNWSQETLTALWTFTCPPSSRPEGRPRSSFSSVVKTIIWFISLFGWDMLERIERLCVFFSRCHSEGYVSVSRRLSQHRPCEVVRRTSGSVRPVCSVLDQGQKEILWVRHHSLKKKIVEFV